MLPPFPADRVIASKRTNAGTAANDAVFRLLVPGRFSLEDSTDHLLGVHAGVPGTVRSTLVETNSAALKCLHEASNVVPRAGLEPACP